MITEYIVAKFFHILIAILALGTSAGLGIVLEFYGGHPTHGSFLLRAIGRIVAFFVIPGYVLMLVTGLWMVNLSWPLTTGWIQAALGVEFDIRHPLQGRADHVLGLDAAHAWCSATRCGGTERGGKIARCDRLTRGQQL